MRKKKQAASKEKRWEFSDSTKKKLSKDSGGRCAFKGCLAYVNFGNPNTGTASHIFSAAPDGPRGRGGLNESEIRSAENGIWTCTIHGRIIDDKLSPYMASDLILWKHVREYVNRLIHKNNTIKFLEPSIGIGFIEDSVWKHVHPNYQATHKSQFELDDAFVENSVLHDIMSSRPYFSTEPKPPPNLSPTVISASLKCVHSTHDSHINLPTKIQHSAIVELTSGWKSQTGIQSDKGIIISAHVPIAIALKNPETGEIDENHIQGTSYVQAFLSDDSVSNQFFQIQEMKSEGSGRLGWILKANKLGDEWLASSSLTLSTGGEPRWSDLYPEVGRYIQYAEVIRKISLGWNLVGQIGTTLDDAHLFPKYHKHFFNIRTSLDSKLLGLEKNRSQRIQFLINLGNEFELSFKLSDFYFHASITDDILKEAAKQIIHWRQSTLVGPPKFFRPLVDIDKRMCLAIISNGGTAWLEKKTIDRIPLN